MLEETINKPAERKPPESFNFKNEYRVERNCICTQIFDPGRREIVNHEFITAKIHKVHPTFLEEESRTNEEMDREINLFCSDLNTQKAYFYNKVTDNKGEVQPLYEGILYKGDISPLVEFNGINFSSFRDFLENETKNLVYEGYLDNSFAKDYFYCQHYIGDDINEFLYLITHDEVEIEVTNEDGKKNLYGGIDYAFKILLPQFQQHSKYIEALTDVALKNYMREVLKSFLIHLERNEIVQKCDNCNELFEFRKYKKFCSGSCRRSIANKANYTRRTRPTE